MAANFRVLFGVLLLIACDRAAPPAPGSVRTTPLPAAAASPAASLDRLDTRAPVPLLPQMANHQKQNMRDHLVAVQEIVAGLAVDDFSGIERAAGRLGFSEQMGQMCTHMGAGVSGFTEQALRFHHTADTIASAARKRDRVAVLAALGGTLQTCTSCHAAWKQQLVDEQTWATATSSPAPRPEMHGAQP